MFRFLPWKYIVQRAARAYGFADPALWLARIRQFAQPSEVQEPIELVRAGVLFHARGIVNAKAIQHNLDWVWPYWVERQFDPDDISFVPRSFSLSHINLTHRNWTAIGLPELAIYPIVDPRGLITPVYDGWSIDFWLIDAAGNALVPSRLLEESNRQELITDSHLSVATTSRRGDLSLQHSASVIVQNGQPVLHIDVHGSSPTGGTLVFAIRPYNPEGVQFIDTIEARKGGDGWCVNSRMEVIANRPADQLLVSDYESGDVFNRIVSPAGTVRNMNGASRVHCKTGMATAASVYRFSGPLTELTVRVPLAKELAAMGNPRRFDPAVTWQAVRSPIAALRVPNQRLRSLYDAAVQTLILLSADDVVPGPYTYRRFWFRDACLMLNALLAIGLADRSRRAIERFAERQLRNGYFRSQEGEWDSNGQVLWIIDRYVALAGGRVNKSLFDAIDKAVAWIDSKRVPADEDVMHAGLLPAGFSAEHLGPNDHYYWDDFWAEAGLRAAERIYLRAGRKQEAENARRLAGEMRRAIERSIERIPTARSLGGIPASPYRRMDAGAIGSLVADYPLQLLPPGAPQIMATLKWLVERCFHSGGFYQDIIHSGINAYLTLDIAQTMLRAGDARYRDLVEAVARLASPTGQWPEAIHPQTGGGCMGDGQHGWAAAEWVMMIRSLFVREEGNRLVVGSGLFEEWFGTEEDIYFGPTLTPWGPITVRIVQSATEPLLTIDAHWREDAPRVDVEVPGFTKLVDANCNSAMRLERSESDMRLPAYEESESLKGTPK
ncbi:MAG TPA: hypothetical protein VJ828_20485 [Lacipirellulaceae bacterium]|nr:hypothetical protein [Lacipirellulaceae bacterium]